MSLRVTEGSSVRASLVGLQANAGRLADLQAQLSSGRQITKPSDSPTGTANALRLRGELSRITQYQNNATDAIGWLSTTDTVMSSIVTQLQTARTLTVQGLNQGTADATSNNAIASQIDQITKSLIALGNSSYVGRPIFGGTTSGQQAFDAVGNYIGDNGNVDRTIGPNTNVTINATGPSVFGSGATSVFTILSNISNALRTNPAALNGSLAQIDTAMQQVSASQASLGAIYNRVTVAQNNLLTDQVDRKSQLSQIQDIDIADMAIRVSSADATYQAALATTAKIRQTSLLDFVR